MTDEPNMPEELELDGEQLEDVTGGLTKFGAGTLTLSGANTYTGTTMVNQGIIAV